MHPRYALLRSREFEMKGNHSSRNEWIVLTGKVFAYFSRIFSSPGQSPGRAIILPTEFALSAASV